MIGAAGATANAGPASLPAASAPLGTPGDAGPAERASAADAVSAPATTATTRRSQAAGSRQDGTASAGAAAGDTGFAALLLARTGEGGTAVATPAGGPATPVDKDNTESNDAAAMPGAATLPGQLLALLGGTWATTPAPAESSAAAPPPPDATQAMATPMRPSTAAAKPGLPCPSQLPASASIPMPGGVPPDRADAPTLADPATVAGAPGESAAPVAASDASAPLPVFPAIAPATAAAPEARASSVAAPIAVPADPQQGFDDGFGARLVWMAEQRLGHAEIRLNPEHLGPIEVRVQVDGTQVSAEFHSAHASVRQTLEASMPRLRELLGQQGLQLNHADVGQRHSGSGQRSGENPGVAVPAGAPRDAQATGRALRSRGLLDEYA